jgi:hypothetical protein
MKKLIIPAVVCLIAFIILSSCDVYGGRRPADYKETKWVSVDPNIYFEVSEENYTITNDITYGKIITNETTTEVRVHFNMGRRVDFRYLPGEKEIVSSHKDGLVFSGECKFGKDKLVVDILSNDAGLLPDDVMQITFVREPLE